MNTYLPLFGTKQPFQHGGNKCASHYILDNPQLPKLHKLMVHIFRRSSLGDFLLLLIVSSAEEASRMVQPPDLRQVTVLTKADWLRIQDELNRVNRDKESMREAANQREALHLQSTEVVKLWSNTIAVSCLYLICFLKFMCL